MTGYRLTSKGHIARLVRLRDYAAYWETEMALAYMTGDLRRHAEADRHWRAILAEARLVRELHGQANRRVPA